MRKASIERVTTETQIKLALTIEGSGRYEVSTGIRFLDHMLELFARHGAFDLKLKATGDLWKTWALPWVKLLTKR
jgi:imidazoleglycerol-phosphate dehydratase